MAIDFPTQAASHRDISAWRKQVYLEGLIDGSHDRTAVQVFFYCNFLVFLYLLTPSLKGAAIRYGIFAANFAVQLAVILRCRSPHPAIGIMVGFFCGWNTLWSANLLIFNNARDRYRKVKRLSPTSYEWQSLPKDFVSRIGWAADLVFNSRGIGWDWKVSGTPSRPPRVEASLEKITTAEAEKKDFPRTSAGRVRFEERGQAIRHYIWLLIQAYVVLDAIKTVTSHDPYFWGLLDAPPPSYLPELIKSSPTLTTSYRTIIAVLFIWQALQLSFTIPQLFLLVAFTPDTAGSNAEAWLYPDQFGGYNTVATRGLAGFWGGWWHMLFRASFQSGSRWLSKKLGLSPKSQLGLVIELTTSFTLSGVLHAAASTTMIGPTKPWTKMYLFFALQPIGIINEIVFAYFMGKYLGKYIPKPLAWAAHLTFTHLWLYFTGPLLAYELATGGQFLYEPVPFSIFRGLGFGSPGDGFYCWEGLNVGWYSDSARPWLSGLVV